MTVTASFPLPPRDAFGNLAPMPSPFVAAVHTEIGAQYAVTAPSGSGTVKVVAPSGTVIGSGGSVSFTATVPVVVVVVETPATGYVTVSLVDPPPGEVPDPLTLRSLITKTQPVANVLGYGADPSGATDSTDAVQAAINAGGVVLIPPGTFSVKASLTATVDAGNVLAIVGTGRLIVPPNSVEFPGQFLSFSGAGTLLIDGPTFDGNGSNQDWSSATDQDYFTAIGGTGNASGPAGRLEVGHLRCIGWQMSASVPQGICINTFGFAEWEIETLLTDACDCSLFVTQPFTTSANRGQFGTIRSHNPTNATVLAEGFGNFSGGEVVCESDALPSTSVASDGVRVLTTNPVAGINIGRLRVINGRYPMLVGSGGSDYLTDSTLDAGYAYGCSGSYNLAMVDGSCQFGTLIADTCASGGIPGSTVFGSFELASGADAEVNIDTVVCRNSQGGGALSLQGPVNIRGGSISGGLTTVSTPKAGSRIANLGGFNPFAVATPGVPAASTAVTNDTGVDVDVYIAGGTDVAVTVNGTATGLASGGFFVPAGGTIELGAYTAAPTWVWVGH